MGKQPVKLKAVIYALSPFQQKVMTGLWKDIPEKIHHKVTENWISATLLVTPVLGTYWSVLSTSRQIWRRATMEIWYKDFSKETFRLGKSFRYAQHFQEQEKLEHRF